MNSGSKKPFHRVYSGEQSIPWGFNSTGAGLVQIDKIAAGVTMSVLVVNTAGNPVPTTGGGGGGGGEVTIVGVAAGISTALPVEVQNTAGNPVLISNVGGGLGGGEVTIVGVQAGIATALPVDGTVTVVQPTHDLLNLNANIQQGDADVGALNPLDVDVNGAVTVTGAVTVNNGTFDVNIIGGSTNQDVRIAAITAGLNLPVSVQGVADVDVNGAVTVTGSVTVNNGTFDVNIIGGSTNQDVRLAAVSAGLTLPVSGEVTVNNGTFDVHVIGGTTNQDVRIAAISAGVTPIDVDVNGAVTVTGSVTVNNSTFDVNIIGGTTNQDVRIAAISAGVTPIDVDVNGAVTITNNTFDVHLVGGTTDQDVRIAGVLSGIGTALPVEFSDTATHANTVVTSSSSETETLVASPGSGTALQVRGFSVFNESQTWVRCELRFGSTAFWVGGVPGCGGAFNWNMLGHYQQSANNKSVIAYIDDAGTVVFSAYYRTA